MSVMDAAQLTARAGMSTDEIDRLAELGILQPDADGRFQEWELGVIRLCQAFQEGGITLEAISRAIAEGHFSFAFVQFLFPEGYRGLTDETFEELCAKAGANLEFVQQVFTAAGFPTPRQGERMREEDA